MKKEKIVFLHLSDIHFRSPGAGDPYDLDKDLRNELTIDAERVVQDIGGLTGILISGDIAFSGAKKDFETALNWLEELCRRLGCPPSDVYMVPGNHDVDRGLIDSSEIIKLAHREIRESHPERSYDEIAKLYRDPFAKEALYAPMANYNEFAAKFGCEISAEDPFWHSDFKLNDGSILRLRGLNSSLISDSLDDDDKGRLVLGAFQTSLERQKGVEYVTLCHHPPSWLFDGESVDLALKSRSKVQLFGHKHSSEIEHKENYVRIAAGATHPDRREPNWCPRYNFLSFYVTGSHEDRNLVVDIYPRTWNGDSFDYDGEEGDPIMSSYPLSLPAWGAPRGLREEPEKEIEKKTETEEVRISKVASVKDPNRVLTYRFFSLPFHSKIAIAQELGILQDDDKGVVEAELVKRFLCRARQQKLLGKLWGKVEQSHNDGKHPENPFIDN